MTLDDRLDNVFMAGLGIAGAEDIAPEDHDRAILNTQKHYTKEAKQAILSDLLEIIGLPEDALPINQLSDEDLVIQLKENATNILRLELRDKVKEYCK